MTIPNTTEDPLFRDWLQHHIIVALTKINDDRLVFKGGTFLRICGLPDYRFSEDLDFDYEGEPEQFQSTIADAVRQVASTTRNEHLRVSATGRGPNMLVLWLSDQQYEAGIKVEANILSKQSSQLVATQNWTVQARYEDLPPTDTIRGYTLTAVLSDKLSCIARRTKVRDFYDVDQLIAHGVDIKESWKIYLRLYDHPEREYGKRIHPSEIRSSYIPKKSNLARDWENSILQGYIPSQEYEFEDLFRRVDRAIGTVLDDWKETLDPGELPRLLKEHQLKYRGHRPRR